MKAAREAAVLLVGCALFTCPLWVALVVPPVTRW